MLLKRYPRVDGLRILSVEIELMAQQNGPLKITILGGFFVAFFSKLWIGAAVAGFGADSISFGALIRLISAFSTTFGAILPDSPKKKQSPANEIRHFLLKPNRKCLFNCLFLLFFICYFLLDLVQNQFISINSHPFFIPLFFLFIVKKDGLKIRATRKIEQPQDIHAKIFLGIFLCSIFFNVKKSVLQN